MVRGENRQRRGSEAEKRISGGGWGVRDEEREGGGGGQG